MQCLETLVGLRGGCADVTSDAGVFTDPYMTRGELSKFVDQNDYPNGVDELFQRLRETAAQEVITGINAHFGKRYIARTVAKMVTLGDAGLKLYPTTAGAELRGVKIWRPSVEPLIGFRVTRVAMLTQYTGNVTVSFVDGVTGQTLGTQVVACVAGQMVEVYVNAFYRTRSLLAVYNATGVAAYQTNALEGGDCYTCPNRWAVNSLANAQGVKAPIGQPLTNTGTSYTGGLILDVSFECDHEQFLCAIRQQLSSVMLWKVCELAMGYAAFVTTRGGTKVVRDSDEIKQRQMMFNDRYTKAFEDVLLTVKTPQEPICFECNRASRIAVAIP